jgi:hypothetical protein
LAGNSHIVARHRQPGYVIELKDVGHTFLLISEHFSSRKLGQADTVFLD